VGRPRPGRLPGRQTPPEDFYGPTRKVVQEQLTRALRELQQGLPIATDDRQTVEQYLRRWLEDAVRPSVRPKTHATYVGYARCHLIPDLGRLPLAKLSPHDVQAMLNRKLAQGLSPRSGHHLRAILRRALSQAVRWGELPRNVAALVDPPQVPHHEARTLTPTEARHFLDAVSRDRLAALFAVALAVGLRQGEALGLRWEDVDLDGGQLAIRHALQRVGGKLQLVEPKTRLSRRTIALPAFAVAALRKHRASQLREQLWAGSKWEEHGLVFTSTIGTPLDGTNVTHRLQRLLGEAGLPRLRFHDLRHTAATLLLTQGVHPRVVMDLLGHSQISLTMNTYSHVIPSLQRDAANQMEAVLVYSARPSGL
jgi:integrase